MYQCLFFWNQEARFFPLILDVENKQDEIENFNINLSVQKQDYNELRLEIEPKFLTTKSSNSASKIFLNHKVQMHD